MDDKINFGMSHEKTFIYETNIHRNKEDVNQGYRPIPRPRTSLLNQIQKVSTGQVEINGKSKGKEEIPIGMVPENIKKESTVSTLQNYCEQIRIIGTKEISVTSNSSMPTTSQLKLREKQGEFVTQSGGNKKLSNLENIIWQRTSAYDQFFSSVQTKPNATSNHNTADEAKLKLKQAREELQRLSQDVMDCESSLTIREKEVLYYYDEVSNISRKLFISTAKEMKTLDDEKRASEKIKNKNIKANLDARFDELIEFERKFRIEAKHYREVRLAYENAKNGEINEKNIEDLN